MSKKKEEAQKPSIERIALFVMAVLLVLAVLYIGVSSNKSSEGNTDDPNSTSPQIPEDAGDSPVEQLSGDEGSNPEPTIQSDQPVGAEEVTPTPRRLEVPPTPTSYVMDSLDDPRAILNLSNPDGYDYFDGEDWFEYDYEVSAAYWLEDGRLYGKDYQPEEKHVYWSFTHFQSGNTYAEITTTNGDCIEKDSVGIVIRVQSDNTPSGYALEVSCDGAWRFRRHRGSKTPEEILDWTTSEYINTGLNASNRLGLWGYMGMFYMFVNGTQVGEYFDRDFPITYGYYAVYTRASRTFEYTASFDDFAFWHIPFIP